MIEPAQAQVKQNLHIRAFEQEQQSVERNAELLGVCFLTVESYLEVEIWFDHIRLFFDFAFVIHFAAALFLDYNFVIRFVVLYCLLG